MRLLALTGVPGTGKTSIAALLAPTLPVRDALTLAREVGAVAGRDEARGADLVDERRFRRRAREALEAAHPDAPALVLEGLLAHHAAADVVVVLRCRPDELARRLARRGWSGAKVAENVEAERLDAIAAEVDAPEAYELDTTEAAPEACAAVVAGLARGESVKDPRLGGLGTYDFLEG